MNLTKKRSTVSILKLAVGLIGFMLVTALISIGHRRRAADAGPGDPQEDWNGTEE